MPVLTLVLVFASEKEALERDEAYALLLHRGLNLSLMPALGRTRLSIAMSMLNLSHTCALAARDTGTQRHAPDSECLLT